MIFKTTGAGWTRSSPQRVNAIALLLALGWLALVALTLTPRYDDFKQYWQAAAHAQADGNLYVSMPPEPATSVLTGTDYPFPNPPLLAYLLIPLAALPQTVAQLVWFALNLLLLLVLIVFCIGLSGSTLARRYWGLVILGTVVTPPARLSLQLGQVSILLALLCVATFALARNQRAGAGLLLALASLIKLYPGLLGLFFLGYRPRQVAYWAAVWVLAIGLVSLWPHGLGPYDDYIQRVLLSGYYPYAAEFNISFVAFWQRLLVANDYALALSNVPRLAGGLTLLCSAAAIAVCFWAGRRLNPDNHALLFCSWLCAMLLIAPVNGYYNLILLLLPLLLLLGRVEAHADQALRSWLIAATLLVCIPPTWSRALPGAYTFVHSGWGILLLTPSFYGLVLYLWLCARSSFRQAEAPRAEV